MNRCREDFTKPPARKPPVTSRRARHTTLCPASAVHQGFIRPRQRDASRAHGFHDVRGAVACDHCPPVPTGHKAGKPILPHRRQHSSNRKLFANKRPSYQDLQQADPKDSGLQGGGHPKQDGHQSEILAGNQNDDFQDQLRQDLVGRPFSTWNMERRTFFRPVVDFTTGARAGSLTYHPRSDEKQWYNVTPKVQMVLRATFGSR
ncbi:unnamed protein product [Ectocarpus sp. CCAP 1310/34]|nr:unnamed protein product [Ectocarpus sp. CCAP 1310/34]